MFKIRCEKFGLQMFAWYRGMALGMVDRSPVFGATHTTVQFLSGSIHKFTDSIPAGFVIDESFPKGDRRLEKLDAVE